MINKSSIFLIVDDEPDMCWALQHILKKKGLVSKVAITGHEAHMLIDSNSFVMAFLDAKLPDTDGLALAGYIRLKAPETHIVMISGYFYKDDGSIQKAITDGLISGFISKPFQHDEIFRMIDAATSA
jgi:DNA-binding NtrC family response regulator